MSEKGLVFRTRKNNHGSKHNHCRASGYPRHNMNYFPGTRLGMNKRYRKKSGELYKEWPYNAWLNYNAIEGLIEKYIGKPFTELEKAFYKAVAPLRRKGKEIDREDLLDMFKGYGKRIGWGSYKIDKDGLVQRDRAKSTFKYLFSTSQIRYNNRVQIPDYGIVCRPFIPNPPDRYPITELTYYKLIRKQDGQPKFIGKFWCAIDGKVLLLPVYNVYYAASYANYLHTKRFRSWYTPFKFGKAEKSETFSDQYRIGSAEYYSAVNIESTWIMPIIPFDRYGGVSTMFKKLRHDRYMSLPNYRITEIKNAIADCLSNAKQSQNEEWFLNRVERLRDELNRTSPTAIYNVGFGQLIPLVRRRDYELALLSNETA